MKIVCFVPVKLQSQRLPNKMLLGLGKKLLVQHMFDTLVDVKRHFDDLDVYCYCSDDTVSNLLPSDVIFLKRPTTLDSNDTVGMDIYTSFVNKVVADVYVLCHATSPFITAESIIVGINKVTQDQFDSAFSVSRIQTFCWYKSAPLNYDIDNVPRTQDIEPVFYETSAFYVFKKQVIDQRRRIGDKAYMVETNRVESVDIDEYNDYVLAQHICHQL
jgi:CMP-N-acetylneuraminic acid synthetase